LKVIFPMGEECIPTSDKRNTSDEFAVFTL
jgi:hypothetical protein